MKGDVEMEAGSRQEKLCRRRESTWNVNGADCTSHVPLCLRPASITCTGHAPYL